MCGGGVRSILLLPLVARCLETIDMCIWCVCFYVRCSDCVGVCGNVCCVAGVVKVAFFPDVKVDYAEFAKHMMLRLPLENNLLRMLHYQHPALRQKESYVNSIKAAA